MHIALLTPTFNHFSGIDRVVEEQAKDCLKQGHKVTIIALQAKIKLQGAKIIELGMPRTPLLERLYRLLFFLDNKAMQKYKLLKNADRVVSHFYPMNLLAQKAKSKYNNEYWYHDHGINTHGDNLLQTLYMRVFLFFSKLSLANADKIHSVSKFLSKELKRQMGLNSTVMYNTIDNTQYKKKINASKIISQYNLKNKTVFLYVGRIAPHKGVHFLLDAFSKVKNSIADATLLIVGKPTFKEYDKALKRKKKDGVIFTGFVKDEDIPMFHKASDVYVTASQWEGFNLPLAEAQMCKKPVVAFNIGSHPEVVKNGKLVKNKDINGFAQAMISLAKNPNNKKYR